ncbi:MAG: 30S ribosomal protein S16 [Alphaproteobacteria bacterium]|nr:30S ribosomal protein S16 [Alphaproteobacteria bacterium]
MVRLRLTRMGAKKKPFYRVVAADQRAPRDGRFIEKLGTYDPMATPAEIKLDLDRVDYWLSVGAQPSDTVAKLIQRARGGAAADAEA